MGPARAAAWNARFAAHRIGSRFRPSPSFVLLIASFFIAGLAIRAVPLFLPSGIFPSLLPIMERQGNWGGVSDVGVPLRLMIPRLGIDVPVGEVGLTRGGGMGVPGSPHTAGWFALGVRPGEPGNAVMDGHLDTFLGLPAVFRQLGDLQPEDEVYVEDDEGELRRFRVTHVETYPEEEAPLLRIFGESGDARLNLITCGGRWDYDRRRYDERTVVYTELADDKEGALNSAAAPASPAGERP